MTDQTTWKSMEKAFHIAIKGHLNVRHQAYVMGKLREIMQVPFDEQVREISSLRNIISECATACGAAVSVECSEEFMAMLPDEIRTVMAGKSREIERLGAELENTLVNWGEVRLELAALKAQPSGVVPVPSELLDAARDVLAERNRQISVEGWTPEHDDAHNSCEMAAAAACYAIDSRALTYSGAQVWPWAPHWWKPEGGYRRMLVKAGALILAEIERIDRSLLNGGRS